MRQAIHTEFIRLDTLMKLCAITPTGGQAKEKIQMGQVQVNGSVCTQRGKKLRVGDCVTVDGTTVEIVGE